MKKLSFVLLFIASGAFALLGCADDIGPIVTPSEEKAGVELAQSQPPTKLGASNVGSFRTFANGLLSRGLVPKDQLQRILGVQALGLPLAKVDVPKARDYEIIELGSLGGAEAHAVAINNRGQVVGWMRTPDGGYTHAFFWENGVLTDLGVFDGLSSDAQDINDLGEVVVTVDKGPVSGYPPDWHEGYSLIWKDGMVRTVISIPGKYVAARSINNRSQVVGSLSTPDFLSTAFAWENGVMASLGTLGGKESFAWSINDRGETAGAISYGGGVLSAFLWQKGVMTRIEGLDGTFSINKKGEIAGWKEFTAVVWQKGKILELGPSIAYSINDRGVVVGQMYLYPIGARGIIWERGTPAELSSLGGLWDLPADINERGQIVGQSNLKAVLWQPTNQQAEISARMSYVGENR